MLCTQETDDEGSYSPQRLLFDSYSSLSSESSERDWKALRALAGFPMETEAVWYTEGGR